MNSQQIKKFKLPDRPGVYFFLGSPKLSEGGQKSKSILYIGKATSLRDRVKSYFPSTTIGEGRLLDSRGPMILDMVTLSTGIKWQETDSVLEALILEANLIKKYQPKYNTKEKDNKSFNYVCITDEKIPKVLIMRGRNILDCGEKKFFSGPRTRGGEAVPDHSKNLFFSSVFGPFPNGQQLKEAMKIIRRLFPYIDDQSIKKNNFEFYRQLNLIPPLLMEEGVGGGDPKVNHHLALKGTPPRQGGEKYKWLISYKKNIRNLKLFFEGKKKKIVFNLKKEMIDYAKKREFEKAGEIKKKIFALEHINDVALIKGDASLEYKNSSRFTPEGPYATQNFYIPTSLRVEAYDIAHMSGQNMVGVMTVIENGEINKNEYRKFIIKTKSKADDTGALGEVLSRRFRHLEWRQPNLIVVDGGVAQINVAKKIFPSIKIVSVLKNEKHKAKAILGDEAIIKKYKKQILLANSEAHRFAITFHKNRRNKNFLK